MKYPKKVEALDMVFYLIGKQGNSYRETQETATNSAPCEIQEIAKYIFQK